MDQIVSFWCALYYLPPLSRLKTSTILSLTVVPYRSVWDGRHGSDGRQWQQGLFEFEQ